MDHEIFTIGYGNRTMTDFVGLLIRYGIEVVCDVRSSPYSKHYPDFSRQPLQETLKASNVKYLFLGMELGARPKDQNLYCNGKASYEAMAQSPQFKSALQRVKAGSETHRIALLCAEKEPLDCHRAILIAPRLSSDGVLVRHINSQGEIESQASLEKRLLKRYGLEQVSLFNDRSASQILNDAYKRRGEDLAYDVDAAYRARITE